jgi:cell division septation protein DedD
VLKFIFWTLVGFNVALFAYSQGLLGSFKASEHEPARLRNQTNTDKLILQLPASAGLAPVLLPAVPPPAPVAAPVEIAEPATVLVACTEIGNFAAAEARRFEKQIAPLELAERQAQVEVDVKEITSHMVMIPPLGSKDAADKKAAELKAQGVSNYFIMNDNTPTKWAISLGVFKSEAAAETLMAALKKQGVTGAKIAGRSSAGTKLAYQFRDIDAATRIKLETIGAKFTAETRSCK